jgi:hypothetical protein
VPDAGRKRLDGIIRALMGGRRAKRCVRNAGVPFAKPVVVPSRTVYAQAAEATQSSAPVRRKKEPPDITLILPEHWD